jgi:Na+-transporting methylmalonyl-CoA/oxaloacetate decarboxylase gamma subunit
MDYMMLLQASDTISKNAAMAERDPYGFIITAVSVLVVFACLIILYFTYRLIGIALSNKATSNRTPKAEETDVEEEIAAAISMALHEHLSANIHDNESYIITIKRK